MSLLIASVDAFNEIMSIILILYSIVLRWEKEKEKVSGHVGRGQG